MKVHAIYEENWVSLYGGDCICWLCSKNTQEIQVGPIGKSPTRGFQPNKDFPMTQVIPRKKGQS